PATGWPTSSRRAAGRSPETYQQACGLGVLRSSAVAAAHWAEASSGVSFWRFQRRSRSSVRRASSLAGLPCFSSQACMSYLRVASSMQVLDRVPMISRALAAVIGSSGDGGTGGPGGGGNSRPVAKLSQAARPADAANAAATILNFIEHPSLVAAGGHTRRRLSISRKQNGPGIAPRPVQNNPEGRSVLT